MIGPSNRRPRLPTLLIVAGCLLFAAPSARGAREIIATRLNASSVSARYGRAVPLRAGGVGGSYVIPTRTRVEVRGSAAGDALFGSFRTAGVVSEVAWS